MFIINVEDIGEENLFLCDEKMYKTLTKHGFSLLGIHNKKYCFFKTEALKEVLGLEYGEKGE